MNHSFCQPLNLNIISSNAFQSQASLEREGGAAAAVSGERILSTISRLQKTRIKFNMKLLGQLGFQDPRGAASDGDSKPAYREQFLPPELSIVSNLMKKVSLLST